MYIIAENDLFCKYTMFIATIWLMSQNIEQLKREFLEYLEIEKGRSLKTIENYDRYLSKFIDFTKVKKPSGITDEVVRKFRLWLNRQKSGMSSATDVGHSVSDTLKKNTQNYYLIALRAFLKFLRRREIDSLSPERI